MSQMMTAEKARRIMEDNFIGKSELSSIGSLKLAIPEMVPEVPFSEEELIAKKNDYLLVLGVSSFSDGQPVTIRNLTSIYGKNPDVSEPCFYNQDWYEHEDFIDVSMKNTWYLIRKNVYEKSRAVQPQELSKQYQFPSAISCVYAFFTAWLSLGIKLWYHDFVWCSDVDHNGDRIYVGKYHDVDGVNKNGFSIHRHLALRPCYACID